MKLQHIFITITLLAMPFFLSGQTLNDAKKWYQEGNYDDAKPVFEKFYSSNPGNAEVNHWLGVIAFKESNYEKARKYLEFASQKKITESFLYLGEVYTLMYRFEDAENEFTKYEKANRRNKDALANLQLKRDAASRFEKLVSRTEDIQIIDSIVVPKSSFLSAYKLSASAGSLQPVSNFFKDQPDNNQILFMNERQDKIYYSHENSELGLYLYSMEKLLDNFGNEKPLSNNVNQAGNQAYPFVMPDGLTLYFSSTGHESLGGYDLFVTRYNLSTDTYLTPNRLNMPFNSPFNDYMMAIDEEKGVGWFASDRFQHEDSVCVYTFIPNSRVVLLDNEDMTYLGKRAIIHSIKESWKPETDYTSLVQLAQKDDESTEKNSPKKDFEFIVNDDKTYYTLSDFQFAGARSIFSQSLNLEVKLSQIEEELSQKRNQFAEGVRNSSISESILFLEKEVEDITSEIETLKARARNEEIRNSF